MNSDRSNSSNSESPKPNTQLKPPVHSKKISCRLVQRWNCDRDNYPRCALEWVEECNEIFVVEDDKATIG